MVGGLTFQFLFVDDTGVSAVQFGNSSTSVLATLAALAEASAPLSNSSETPGGKKIKQYNYFLIYKFLK